MTSDAIKRVKWAAARAAASRAVLEQAIRDAHREGESLRTIAKAARVSHEQVRRIVGPSE